MMIIIYLDLNDLLQIILRINYKNDLNYKESIEKELHKNGKIIIIKKISYVSNIHLIVQNI